MTAPDVIFPNLGITIDNLGVNTPITLPFIGPIAWYGVFVTLGVLAGVGIGLWNVKRCGGNVSLYVDFAYIVIPACIVGTRLYYVIFNWDFYSQNLLQILNFRSGLAIYGAIITAFITALIYCRVKKENFFKFADLGIIGLPMGQAVGRWGNFVNREAFGGYTDGLFAMQYRYDQVHNSLIRDAQDILDNFVYVLVNGEYVRYIQVHPTFLYESLWNIATVIILYLVVKRRKFNGQIAAMYLLLYGIGRFWIEALRTDQLTLLNTDIAVSQVLSGVIAVAAAGFIVVNIVLKQRKKLTQS